MKAVNLALEERLWVEARKAAIDNRELVSDWIGRVVAESLKARIKVVRVPGERARVKVDLDEAIWREVQKAAIDAQVEAGHLVFPSDYINQALRNATESPLTVGKQP